MLWNMVHIYIDMRKLYIILIKKKEDKKSVTILIEWKVFWQ